MCLEVTLTKHMKNLYDRNFKTFEKETEDVIRWNDLPCSWTNRINIIKMSILPKAPMNLKSCTS